MAASNDNEGRRQGALSYTQEIPLLEQLLAETSSGDALPSSSLGSVDERLQALLRVAVDNEQQERVARIRHLQQQFERVVSRLQQRTTQTLQLADVQLFRPRDVLRRSVGGTAAGFLSRSAPGNDDDDDDDANDSCWISTVMLTPLHPDDEATDQAAASSSDQTAASSSNQAASSSSVDQADCTVCWLPMENAFSLRGCNDKHTFCAACWRSSFNVFISEADLAGGLACLHQGCTAVADEGEIASVVTPDMYERYLRFSVLAVINAKPETRWCPNPACAVNLSVDAANPPPELKCTDCGTVFCPACSKPPHPGSACRAVLTETEKQLAKWLASIGLKLAKRCPGCRELVEKNEGCNHMTCRCGAEWCWLCRTRFFEDYSTNNHYNTDQHFHGGDSVCYRLHFCAEHCLRDARARQFGSMEQWTEWRLANNIETLKEWRERTARDGFFTRQAPEALVEWYARGVTEY